MSLSGSLATKFFETGIGRSLRHPHYRLYSLTNFASIMGIWQQRVAMGWLAWDLTHSGFWLGMLVTAEAVPLIVLVAVAGAVVDRVDRLKLLRVLQITQVALAALLAALTVAGMINIYLLTLLSFCYGLVQSFHLPARMTMAPNLVPKDDLTPAIGLNSALFNISRFFGPMIAGVVIAQFGAGAAFATAVFGMLAFSIGLHFVELNRHEQTGGKRKGLGSDILEGVTYVLRHTSIGPLLLLIMVSAIFSRSFLELFPGFADEVFDQGAEGLGILFSAVGGGGIVGAFWLANYGKTEGLMKVSLVTLFITAIALILFASTTVFWFALICAASAGLTMAITANASQVLIQNTVDGAFRGRVMSLYGLTYRAGPSVGALLLGSASTLVGFQWPVILGGALCLFSIALVIPGYKRLSSELEKTA